MGTNVRTDARSQDFLVPHLEEIAAMTTTRAPMSPDRAYCEEECTTDLDCPQRMTCTEGPSARRTCALTGLQAGQFAGVCAESGACEGGLCVALDDGACRCWQSCGAPPDDPGAGCSAAPGSGAGLGGAITLGLALLLVAAGGCRGANGQPSGHCPSDAVPQTATIGDTVQDWCAQRDQPTVRHGPFVEWFDAARAHKRREGRFVAGAQDGTWTSWYDNGQVERQLTYARGVMHGPTTAYHDDGVRQEVGAYGDGRRVGHWTEWHETGAVKRETDYLAGGHEERWRAFTAAGVLLQEGVFVDAQRHGPFVEYHPNGSKAAEGRYEQGQKVGAWRTWSADGQPMPGE
jgi:antitoxin component YwqK of YwqJK toxin-antitoxin module